MTPPRTSPAAAALALLIAALMAGAVLATSPLPSPADASRAPSDCRPPIYASAPHASLHGVAQAAVVTLHAPQDARSLGDVHTTVTPYLRHPMQPFDAQAPPVVAPAFTSTAVVAAPSTGLRGDRSA